MSKLNIKTIAIVLMPVSYRSSGKTKGNEVSKSTPLKIKLLCITKRNVLSVK